jgi:hypothetical protein
MSEQRVDQSALRQYTGNVFWDPSPYEGSFAGVFPGAGIGQGVINNTIGFLSKASMQNPDFVAFCISRDDRIASGTKALFTHNPQFMEFLNAIKNGSTTKSQLESQMAFMIKSDNQIKDLAQNISAMAASPKIQQAYGQSTGDKKGFYKTQGILTDGTEHHPGRGM